MGEKLASLKRRIHRYVSWILVPSFMFTVITGYAMTRHWFQTNIVLTTLHRISEWFFISLLLAHLLFTSIVSKITWKTILSKLKEGKAKKLYTIRLIQKVTSYLIVIFSILVIISGLYNYAWFALKVGEILPFSLHRNFDVYLNLLVIIHVSIGLYFLFSRMKVKRILIKIFAYGIIASLSGGIIYLEIPQKILTQPPIDDDPYNPTIPFPYNQTHVVKLGGVEYVYNSSEISTIRPDIFREDHFSLFDVLLYLDNQSSIDLEYHYDSSMGAHIIDIINNQTFWWYKAWYDGGWPEINAMRMDMYPWKPGTSIEMYKEPQSFFDKLYDTWQSEIVRRDSNSGAFIIPYIEIDSNTFREEFYNITVTAHNLRSDIFQEGIITPVDIIMSLGDQGLITYLLRWYDSFGNVEIVRSYWLVMINDDLSIGRCGYVHEVGDFAFTGAGARNHLHIPMDFRPLIAPEYLEVQYTCL